MVTAEKNVCAAILADWGTSNLRIWALDEGGRVLARAASADGAGGLGAEGFEAVLRRNLAALGAVWPASMDLPVVICGMAGARDGWHEAGYVPVPATPAEGVWQAVRVKAEGLDIRILPGLSRLDAQGADVMRGEETQLLGLVVSESNFSGVVCLPGTHSKWVQVERGRILDFHTAMTGELFALLSRQSVLRHVIGQQADFTPDSPEFESGLVHALARPERLILDLFSIRAEGLLAGRIGAPAMARLSGLLIGTEIAASLAGQRAGAAVALAAGGKLAPLYARALTRAARAFRFVDAEMLALTGLRAAARYLFPGTIKDMDI